MMQGVFVLLLVNSPAAHAQKNDPLAEGFKKVPQEMRMRMFWRVFGPAWQRDEIDYQLDALKQAGLGGVMTSFFYPVSLDDPAAGIVNQKFLSPEFQNTLRYATTRAQQLGLKFSVFGGTGWPFGGPSVRPEDAAQRIRMVELKARPDANGYELPALRAEERLLAAFLGQQEITDRVRGGKLGIKPDTTQTCRAFIVGPTYMQVKRPALGGEGLVIDHLDRQPLRRYLETVVAPMLRSAPPGSLNSIFCDSLEVYNTTWTTRLPEHFLRRRNYSLIEKLPSLFDDQAADVLDVRYDFWRTIAEVAESEFARPLYNWCKQHNVALEFEAYGTPSMGLTAARYSDVPAGEQYEWKGFSFTRFASSGAHLTAKPIIGAEAWTWTGIPNRLGDSLSDLKLCSDLHFLAGANALIGVDFPYSPRSVGSPGWLQYFGPVMGINNPQWPYFHYLVDYINRCQYLLQQGKPVADVALYLPIEDSFASSPPTQLLLNFQLRDRLATGEPTGEFSLKNAYKHHSDIIHTLLRNGYNYDGIDFFAMNALARVTGATLTAGHGQYSMLVLPPMRGIDLKAMEKIARFCESGGTVIAIGRLPEQVYGAKEKRDTPRLKKLLADLFGTQTGAKTIHSYGKGLALFAPDAREGLASALRRSNVSPDLHLEGEPATVLHVHRRIGNRDIYFIANVGEERVETMARFRVTGKNASYWSPYSGDNAAARVQWSDDRETAMRLFLAPHSSFFVVFTPGRSSLPAPRDTKTLPVGAWVSNGRSIDFEGEWKVTFDGPDAPPPLTTRKLTSWTNWPGAKFFSGRATYTTTLTLPEPKPLQTILQFERIHEVGEVFINDQLAGVVGLWGNALDITPHLKPGSNSLRIVVANLPVNRVLGLPEPDLRPLRQKYGNRFPDPQEKRLMQEPAPSGLVGNVMLHFTKDR